MPFLWRSKSKRKTNKVKDPPPEPAEPAPAYTISNGLMHNDTDSAPNKGSVSPPKLPERNKKKPSGASITSGASQNRSSVVGDAGLLMIKEDYTGHLDNELDVQRGQIVRKLHAQEGWMFVKNVDGICGYVPSHLCSLLEEMQDSANYETVPPLPAMARRSLVPVKSGPSSAFPYNSLPGTPSFDTPSPYSRQRHSDTPFASIASPPLPKNGCGEVSANGYDVLENRKTSSTQSHPLADLSPILHPLHPRSITKYYELENNSAQQNQEQHQPQDKLSSLSSSLSSDTQQPSTPAAQHLYMHLRTDSYQEAVVDEHPEAKSSAKTSLDQLSVPKVQVQRPSTLHFNPNYDHLDNYTATTTEGGIMESVRTCSSQLADDVFLPSTSKPCGIYRVLEYYEKKAAGELTVRENEYVIVVELGRGEWTTIINCCNEEGIVPKSILSRYTYNDSMVNAGTQTELLVTGHVQTVPISRPSSYSRPVCSSANSAGTQGTDSVYIGEIPITHRRYSLKHTTEMAVQTDTSPMVGNAWTQSRSHSIENLWYENSMSIPQLTGLDMGPGIQDTPSIRTLPTFNDGRHERGTAPMAYHTSRHSLPQLPSLHFPPIRKERIPVQNGHSPIMPIRNGHSPIMPTRNGHSPIMPFKKLNSQDHTHDVIINGYGRKFTPTPNMRRGSTPITGRVGPVINGHTPTNGFNGSTPIGRRGSVPINNHSCRYSILSSIQDGSSLTPSSINGRDNLDWPVSPEIVSNVSSSGLKPQMVVLTATKDFAPDVDGSSCMAVRKGDILHLYPGNNVHQGWLWAYHVREEMYGFVPKSHTAFVYMTAGRLRQNLTLCDLV